MVKNIFSIGYHHNMFIIEIIVNTDIAASYGLCQKRPLNNGLSIAIKGHVDILVMIYFFPISIVYKDIYQHVVFPTIRSKHIIISQKKRSIVGQCRAVSIVRVSTKALGISVPTLYPTLTYCLYMILICKSSTAPLFFLNL